MLKSIIKEVAYTVAPNWSASLHQRLWLLKQAKLLREQCRASENLDQLIDTVLDCQWFRPIQKRTEILALLKILEHLKPKLLCEVGAAGGGTLFSFSAVSSDDAQLLSIDIAYTSAQRKAYARMAKPGQQITCLAGDSHSPATLNRVREWLNGR